MDDKNSSLRVSEYLDIDVEKDADCSVYGQLRTLSSSSFTSLCISSDKGCAYCNILLQALLIRDRDAVDCGDDDEVFLYSEAPLSGSIFNSKWRPVVRIWKYLG